MRRHVDLNADVGEGVGDDTAMLGIVSSVNVACGFHAGDPETMRAVCATAVARGVTIGAQPSYRDREGFGRRPIEIGYDELVADLIEQIEALRDAAGGVGATIGYLKPHGALYNQAADDDLRAAAIVAACARYGLPVLGLPGSRLLDSAAAAGLQTGREFFADRAYDARGRLVPRGTEGAVIDDPAVVAHRVEQLLAEGSVRGSDGSDVLVEADSICVHGDTPGAVLLAETVRSTITANGGLVEALW